MAFTAVYDACVLYPVSLRDLFVRLGQTGLFRAKWTERILDEFVEALLAKRPELKDSLDRQREPMRNAVRDVDVRDYARLISVVPALPDQDDAQIEAQHPDTFVMHLIDLDREAVEAVVEAMAANKKNPPMTYDDVLDTLHAR